MFKQKRILALILALSMLLTMGIVFPAAAAAVPPPALSLARQAAAEGIVLLENPGVLPLPMGENIALFGQGQINTIKGGYGSGGCHVEHSVHLLEGLQNKAAENKLVLNADVLGFYTQWTQAHPIQDENQHAFPEPEINAAFSAMVTNAAAVSDTALVVIARTSGEGDEIGRASCRERV